uniref:Uncharacterized protein LOC104216762 n=1 Tax=Nicotiana sylvestris TaxID=4096 RepID=A0A1U7VAX4_NICSY|nr:PREDICTED: uncharacterized protein LOC104216762 [Nicotiana sylvestris]
MSKFCVNGYKFHTEECSKYKKSNNSGVCVKGGEGNQDGENDFCGVIKEILELSYSGWPYKKIILFRCKWFDPTPRRERVRQVYYAPYPLRRDKADWLVVIKTKPVGRVEVENVLDVAYQNDTSSVNQMVDDQLENYLEHPQRILEEVDMEEITIIENEDEESPNENEISEEDGFLDEEGYVDEDD